MIAVTGATGLLGRVLLFDLILEEQKVRALCRATSNRKALKEDFFLYHEGTQELWDKIEWVEVDFEDVDSLEKALIGVKRIYHCAGEVSFDPRKEKKIFKTNVEATQNLLYALENTDVESFLHVSSIAVLDGLNAEGEADETCDFNPKLVHSSYAISKHIAELEVMRASAEGLRVIVVNPGIILGSGNWKKSSGELYSKYKNLSFAVPGISSYVDVRDVSKACRLLMNSEPKKERYILVSESKSNEWVANYVRAKFGKKKIKVLPPFLLKLGVGLQVLLGWLIPPLRMLNAVNVRALCSKNKVSSEQFKNEFNFEFIPVEDSLDYHLHNYKNKEKSSL